VDWATQGRRGARRARRLPGSGQLLDGAQQRWQAFRASNDGAGMASGLELGVGNMWSSRAGCEY